jgi:hypothetical protein
MSVVEYRDVVGFPGYRVGSDGSIWCCLQTGPNRQRCLSENWRRKKPRPRPDGYIWVNLILDRKGYGRALHRLVLEAFVGPAPEGYCGCHENGDRSDNRLSNLRWDTVKNNLRDRKRHNTMPIQVGEANNAAKLSERDVRTIRRLRAAGAPRYQVAAKFGVHTVTVGLITAGKRWAHVT